MDGLLASVILVLLVLFGYVSAWQHAAVRLVVLLAATLAVVALFDTGLSVLVRPTGEGWDLFMEVGPALLMGASVAAGYYYAWMRKPFHVLVCILLAVTSLVLGWRRSSEVHPNGHSDAGSRGAVPGRRNLRGLEGEQGAGDPAD